MTLTAKQRAQLRSLAHPLKPVLHLGKDGLTEQSVRSLEEAFNGRELLKVKVQAGSPLSVDDAGAELVARVPGAHLVQTIGRTVVLYRKHPEKPGIQLRS
jgi:RNA-binding protein